jgi:hypothetical protein
MIHRVLNYSPGFCLVFLFWIFFFSSTIFFFSEFITHRRQVRLGVQQILSNQLLNASTAINSPFFMSDKTNAEVSVPEHAKQVPTAKTFQLVFLCVQKHAIWELGEFAIDVV